MGRPRGQRNGLIECATANDDAVWGTAFQIDAIRQPLDQGLFRGAFTSGELPCRPCCGWLEINPYCFAPASRCSLTNGRRSRLALIDGGRKRTRASSLSTEVPGQPRPARGVHGRYRMTRGNQCRVSGHDYASLGWFWNGCIDAVSRWAISGPRWESFTSATNPATAPPATVQ